MRLLWNPPCDMRSRCSAETSRPCGGRCGNWDLLCAKFGNEPTLFFPFSYCDQDDPPQHRRDPHAIAQTIAAHVRFESILLFASSCLWLVCSWSAGLSVSFMAIRFSLCLFLLCALLNTVAKLLSAPQLSGGVCGKHESVFSMIVRLAQSHDEDALLAPHQLCCLGGMGGYANFLKLLVERMLKSSAFQTTVFSRTK